MVNKLKPLWLITASIILGTLVFFLLILLFVDNQVLNNTWLITSYLVDIKRTYILSLPSYGFFFALSSVILLYDYLKSDNEYGDAQFASNSEIAKMHEHGLYENQGSILALKDGRYIRTNVSLSTLIVAPQGTGKTAAVIVPTLLSDTSSFIINDIKGELWDLTSKQRSHFGKVGVFAPSQHLLDGLRWNPLDEKCLPSHFDDQIDFVERIGAILYPTEQDGMDATAKHFNAEAKSIFTYWAMFLISRNGGTSLPEVYMTALESDDMQAAIACDMDDYGEDWHPILMTIANSILGKGGNEYQGTVTTFKQALEPFSRPNIARNLQDCDFTHKDFKSDKPFSLYLFIPANDVNRMAPIVRMLVEYLVNEFLSLTDKEVIKRQRVVFCMDEFPRMGYMKALKEAPALQRSYLMASIFVAQDKNQLETTYGKGSFDQFVTTTDFKVIFRQNEDTTAARFSSLVGKTTRKKKSVTQQDLKLLGSSSVNSEGVPLLLPQDFMNQKKNDLYILASGNHERPIKAKCAWWFKDANMKKLVGAYKGLTISDLSLANISALNEENSSSLTNETCKNDDNDVNNINIINEEPLQETLTTGDSEETPHDGEPIEQEKQKPVDTDTTNSDEVTELNF